MKRIEVSRLKFLLDHGFEEEEVLSSENVSDLLNIYADDWYIEDGYLTKSKESSEWKKYKKLVESNKNNS